MINVINPARSMRMKALGTNSPPVPDARAAERAGRSRNPNSSPPAVATPTFSTSRRDGDFSDSLIMSSCLGRAFDCRANPHIGAATADVARHRGIDVCVGGLRCGCEQCGGRHDLAGLAVAALDDFEIEPGFLHLGTDRRLVYRLDGRHRAIADSANRQEARAHRRAIDMHGARTALRNATTEFRAG